MLLLLIFFICTGRQPSYTLPDTLFPATPRFRSRGRHGSPRAGIAAALTAIGGVTAVSPIMTTPPLGSSIRRFANMVAIIESDDDPPALLRRLKAIEHAFGRRRGRRWGARVIDLDIIL